MILGSASPRRREILNFFSLPFEQIPSQFDEKIISYEGDPILYAKILSEKKAEHLSKYYLKEVILTADTIVYFDNKVYNKPKDSVEALQFLEDFSGKWNHVFTALTIRKGNDFYSAVEETRLLFNELTEKEKNLYLHFASHLDKAGAYTIQQAGSLIVKKIEGCYYNVMGLPINTLRRLLLNVGIDLWDYLKSF